MGNLDEIMRADNFDIEAVARFIYEYASNSTPYGVKLDAAFNALYPGMVWLDITRDEDRSIEARAAELRWEHEDYSDNDYDDVYSN